MAETKMILDFIGAVAWPSTILTIALIYRKPIYDLLSHFGGIAGRAAKQAAKISAGGFNIEFTEAVAAKNPKDIHDTIEAATDIARGFLPYGVPIAGHPGFVVSPYAPTSGYIDVRGFSP